MPTPPLTSIAFNPARDRMALCVTDFLHSIRFPRGDQPSDVQSRFPCRAAGVPKSKHISEGPHSSPPSFQTTICPSAKVIVLFTRLHKPIATSAGENYSCSFVVLIWQPSLKFISPLFRWDLEFVFGVGFFPLSLHIRFVFCNDFSENNYKWFVVKIVYLLASFPLKLRDTQGIRHLISNGKRAPFVWVKAISRL